MHFLWGVRRRGSAFQVLLKFHSGQQLLQAGDLMVAAPLPSAPGGQLLVWLQDNPHIHSTGQAGISHFYKQMKRQRRTQLLA